MPGPLGRSRVIAALPLANNPPQVQWPPRMLVDHNDFLLIDPTDASVIGWPGLRVPRLITATRTRDTRRL